MSVRSVNDVPGLRCKGTARLIHLNLSEFPDERLVVALPIVSMVNTAVARGAKGDYVGRVIWTSVRYSGCVMRFEIGLLPLRDKRRRFTAAFANTVGAPKNVQADGFRTNPDILPALSRRSVSASARQSETAQVLQRLLPETARGV